MYRKLSMVGLACLLAPSVAFAQLPQPGEAMGNTSDETGKFKKVTEYDDMEDENVEGATLKPDEQTVKGESHAKRPSLIRVRQNFIPELLTSVDDI